MRPASAHVPPRSTPHWALSPASVWLSAPLWVVGFVVNEPVSYRGLHEFAIIVLISVLGAATLALVLLKSDRIPAIRRAAGYRAWILVALVIIGAAEARLAVLIAGMRFAALDDPVPVVERAVGAALLALVAYILAAASLESWAHYRDQRAQLVATLVADSRLTTEQAEAISAMSQILEADVESELERDRSAFGRELDALTHALRSGHDGRAQFARAHERIDQRWRRLSTELWAQHSVTVPVVGFRELAWSYASTQPFSGLSLVGGGLAMVAFVFSRVLEPPSALAALALWSALALAAWALGRGARSAPGRPSVVAVSAGGGALVLFPAIALALGIITSEPSTFVRVAWVNLQVVAMILMTSAPPAIARSREAVLEGLRRGIDAATLQRLQNEARLAAVTRALAARVHGSARNALLGLSLQLQNALDAGDTRAAMRHIGDMRAALAEADPSDTTGTQVAVTVDDIASLIDAWRSVCDIRVEAQWGSMPSSCLRVLRDLLDEAIADAVRHARCSTIDVAIAARSDRRCVSVRLRNDGRPLSSSGSRGLGSRNLDLHTAGQWERSVDSNGWTQLTFTLHC